MRQSGYLQIIKDLRMHYTIEGVKHYGCSSDRLISLSVLWGVSVSR